MYATIEIDNFPIEIEIKSECIIDAKTGEVLYSPANTYPWGSTDEEYFSPLVPIVDQSKLRKIWKSR